MFEAISHSNKHIGSIYGNGSSWKQMGPCAAAVGTGIYLAAEAQLPAQNKWREQTHCAIFKLLPNGVISRQ